MRWWCSQLYEPWSWTPRPYLGVWLIVAALVAVRYRVLRRRKLDNGSHGLTTRQRVWFWLGVAAFWIASDWPVGALGAGYLASLHMGQYMLYTFVSAPLLLLALPEWWLRTFLARRRVYRLVRWLSRPLHAAVISNTIILSTMMPWTVDTFRATQLGSFLLDVIWMVGGWIMWYPVISPIIEHRVPSPPLRCAYLFAAAGIVSLLPAGMLTFSATPLYESYEIAPRVGLDALADQQLAGAIMKVASLPIVWITMATIWLRWATADRAVESVPVNVDRPPSGSA